MTAQTLTDRAMLISLNVKAWTARKHDKKISDEVAATHNATKDSGRYNKVLIASTALGELNRITGAAREHHYENTLPWANEGARILPSANFFAYMTKQKAYKAEFEAAAAKFIDAFPIYVAEAKVRLNGMFKEADYPSPMALKHRFSFGIDIMPMPDAKDFRVTLSADEQAQIRTDIEAKVADATQRAINDLWHRVYDAVAHMHERLAAYAVDPATGKVTGGIFRDTLVTNLRDLAELLPRLNVTSDPELEACRQELLAKLCAHDADALREDPTVREKTKMDAAAILEMMAGYVTDET